MIPRKRIGRKVLVASLGVAAVSYVACGGSTDSGNNTSDGGADAAQDQFVSGNLMGQPYDAKQDTNIEDAPLDQLVANLVPPPPEDAGDAGDAQGD